MRLLMETYKIGDYSGIQIECWAKRDFYILLKREYVRPEKISRMKRLLAGNPFCKPVSTFQFKELISGK